jgi:hypothetical protein
MSAPDFEADQEPRGFFNWFPRNVPLARLGIN